MYLCSIIINKNNKTVDTKEIKEFRNIWSNPKRFDTKNKTMGTIEPISKRLATTISNIEFQQGRVFWDDLEKLEEVLQRVQELEEKLQTK